MVNWAVYRPGIDGNVFDWILQAAKYRRKLKKQERNRAIEEIAKKSEILDRTEVEDKKWKAVNARLKSHG